jgi:hypothetical protein
MRLSSLPVGSLVSVCGLAIAAPAFAQTALLPVTHDALNRVYPLGGVLAPPGGGHGGSGGTDATVGPDVAVGEIQGSDNGSSLSLTINALGSDATYWAYGLGTTSCNLGNANVQWNANANTHPVIPVNMYKMHTVNGSQRFEQVGQSWAKHAFDALTENACALGCSGQGGSVLGVGCSDPYTAGRNGNQANVSGGNGGVAPRYFVNPFTAVYTWPVPTEPPLQSGSVSRRCRVLKTDVEATNSSSVSQFFAEALYITHDDAVYGNNHNNATYRRMFCTNASTGAFSLEGTGAYNNGVHRYQPAIYGWQAYGNNNTFDSSVTISEVSCGQTYTPPSTNPAGDGWLYIASKTTNLGNGMYHYEYAVENYNSDRMGGSFTIPFPVGATITNVDWKGGDNHDGIASEDATRNAAWVSTISSNSVSWAAPVAYDPANPTLGNGVRWGTMYNFRFDSNAAPAAGQATLGYYKPLAGYPNSVNGNAWVPATLPTCYANCDGSTTVPVLNVNDFTCFLQKFAQNDPYANCDGSTTVPVLNVSDFTCFLQSFAQGCP